MTERVWFEFEGNVDFVRGTFEYVADVKQAIHKKLGQHLSHTPVSLRLFLPPMQINNDDLDNEPVELRGDMLCSSHGINLLNMSPSTQQQHPRHLLVVGSNQRSRPTSPAPSARMQHQHENDMMGQQQQQQIPQMRSTTPHRPQQQQQQHQPQPPSGRVFMVGDEDNSADESGLVRDSDEQQHQNIFSSPAAHQQQQQQQIHYGNQLQQQPSNPRAAMFARVSQERQQQQAVVQQQPSHQQQHHADTKIRLAVDVVAAYRQEVVLGTLHVDVPSSLLRPVAFSSSNSSAMVMTPAARKNADAARVRQILDLTKSLVSKHVVVIESPSTPPQLVRVMAYDAEFSEFVLLTESSNVHIAQSFNSSTGAMSRALIAVIDYPTPAEFVMPPEARGGFIVSQPGFLSSRSETTTPARGGSPPQRESSSSVPRNQQQQQHQQSPHRRGQSPDSRIHPTAPAGSSVPFAPPAAYNPQQQQYFHHQPHQQQKQQFVSPRHLGGMSPSQQQQQNDPYSQAVSLHPTHESVLTKLELAIAQLSDERQRRIVAERVIAEREASIAEQIHAARKDGADAARQAQNARLEYLNAQFLATSSQLEEAKMKLDQLRRGDDVSGAYSGTAAVRVQELQQENQDLRRARAENEAELDALRNKRDMLQQQLDRAADNHDDMTRELDMVRLQVTNLALDKSQLAGALEEERRRKFSPEAQDAVEAQLLELRASNNSLGTKVDRLNRELSSANEKLQIELNKASSREQELDSFRREWGGETTRKSQRIAELEARLAAAAEGDQAASELVAARAATQKARDERDEESRKVYEATQELSAARGKMAELEREVSGLKQQISSGGGGGGEEKKSPSRENDELDFGFSDEDDDKQKNSEQQQELQTKLDAANEELQRLQRELSAAKNEARALQDQLGDTAAAKDREIARLQSESASEHDSLELLERRNAELNERLQRALKTDAAEDLDHAKELAAMRKTLNALQLERDDIKSKLDDAEKEIALSSSSSQRSPVVVAADQTQTPSRPGSSASATHESPLSFVLREQTAKVDRLEMQLQHAKEENQSLMQKLAAGGNDDAISREDAEELRALLAEQKVNEEALVGDYKALKTAKKEAEEERDMLKAKLAAGGNDDAISREDAEELRALLAEQKVNEEALVSDYKALKTAKKEAEEERDMLKAKLDGAESGLQVEWSRVVKAQNSSTDNLADDMQNMHATERGLEEQLGKRNEENASLRTQLSELSSACAEKQSEFDVLSARHEQATQRRDDLSRQLEELNESFMSIRERLQKRNDALSSELHDAREQIEQLRDERNEALRTVDDERAQHDNTRRDFEVSVRRQAVSTPEGAAEQLAEMEAHYYESQRELREKEETIARNAVEESESLAFRLLQKEKEEVMVRELFGRSGMMGSSSNNNNNAVSTTAPAKEAPARKSGFTITTTSTSTKLLPPPQQQQSPASTDFALSDSDNDASGVSSRVVSSVASPVLGPTSTEDAESSNLSFGMSSSDNDSNLAAATAAAATNKVTASAAAADSHDEEEGEPTKKEESPPLSDFGGGVSDSDANKKESPPLSDFGVSDSDADTGSAPQPATVVASTTAEEPAADVVPEPPRRSPTPPATRTAEEDALNFENEEDIHEKTMPPEPADAAPSAPATAAPAATNDDDEDELNFDDDTFSFDSGTVKSSSRMVTSSTPAPPPPPVAPVSPPIVIDDDDESELNFSTDTGDNIKPAPRPATAAAFKVSPTAAAAAAATTTTAAKSAMGNIPAPPKSFQLANADSSDDDFSFGSSGNSSPASRNLKEL